jgi:hypothetical protein
MSERFIKLTLIMLIGAENYEAVIRLYYFGNPLYNKV